MLLRKPGGEEWLGLAHTGDLRGTREDVEGDVERSRKVSEAMGSFGIFLIALQGV